MKIKRCPFCGAKADLIQQYNNKLEAYFLWVECQSCKSRGKTTSTKIDVRNGNWKENKYCKRAVMSWNNRIPIDVIKKIAHSLSYIRDCNYSDGNSHEWIWLDDLDYIIDNIYDDKEMEDYYGKLVSYDF